VFRYFIDLFARQLTGSQTLSDVDVNLVQKTLVPHPALLEPKRTELQKLYEQLKAREQASIHEEIKKEDRRQLDTIILQAVGLSGKEVDELYEAASRYIRERQEKSDSMRTPKPK
jgi:hydroxymethylpyrimidine/phosphomethylpyrimidine kinase